MSPRHTLLTFIVFLAVIAVQRVEVLASESASRECATDSSFAEHARVHAQSVASRRIPGATARWATGAEICAKALQAWPADSAEQAREVYVFTVENAAPLRFAIVRLNPGYTNKTEWPFAVCLFDRDWRALPPCNVSG